MEPIYGSENENYNNIIIIIGFIFTVIGNIRICNIVHWYKKINTLMTRSKAFNLV